MNFLVTALLSVPAALALVMVFLFPALESSCFVGFIFPGETAVVVGGVLASQGKFPLWIVLVLAVAGAVLGDSVGYWVGRRYGDWLIDHLPRRLVKRENVDRAVDFIGRKGGVGVFIGRFTTVLRVLIPGAAGLSKMHYRKFLIYNGLGGLAWGVLYGTLGYIAGANYRVVVKDAGVTSYVVLVVVVAALVTFGVYRHIRGVRTPD